MSQINLRCKVLYMPGPWGTAVPATGVSVRLEDLDVGNSNDTLYTGATNAAGEFSGLTADWRDSRSVKVGAVQSTVFDPTDVMSLRLIISQAQGSLPRRVTLPFVPAPSHLPQPPIVIPWGPLGMTRVTIDGTQKDTLPQIQQALRGLLDSGVATGVAVGGHIVRHEIAIYGTQMAAFRRELNELDGRLRELGSIIEEVRRRELTAASTRTAGMRGSIGTNMERAGSAGTTTMQRVGPNIDTSMSRTGSRISPATTRVGAPIGDAFRATTNATQATWETARARLLDLCALMEPRARAASNSCAAGTSQSDIVAAVVAVVVATVVASLSTTVGGPALVAATMAACVSCVATIFQSTPTILRAAALIHPWASALLEPADELERFMAPGTWMHSLILFVLIACAIVLMLAVSPAAGWRWIIEAVTNSEGTAGMRFVFTQ
ncbi:MAG: hypothetical protein KAY46_18220 [Burkholderiaceae bacterium]|nr:hypothetical protein [Burkholderiaceae bacterium]